VGRTTIIKTDRITMQALTAQPATVVAGDWWFRVDLGRPYYAIDTVVANAKMGVIRPVETDDLGDLIVTTIKIADLAVNTAKIADLAVTGPKIADGAVTDVKIVDVSPGKILTGDLNLGTGILTCGEVRVGDITLNHGWSIKETPEALQFLKDGEVVFEITRSGAISCRNIKVE